MSRQLYGEDHPQTFWPPLLVAIVVTAFCFFAWLTSAQPPQIEHSVKEVRQDSALGPGRDQRGCMHAAGYVWCEGVGKCIRPWKDSCPGGTEFCRSYCSKDKSTSAKPQLAMRGVAASHSVYCRCDESGKAIDYTRP
mmetsp:Transcript_113088/g.316014  ORF Transcript_113088/g.316014 Transcript_113088/m.316014 type:complete len:137 (+) Transcript_113088:185-595(+)